MNTNILNLLQNGKKQNAKKVAVLIDPDKTDKTNIQHLIQNSIKAQVDFFFIGGSLLIENNINYWNNHIKQTCDIPLIIFPGNPLQINGKADAIFFLSLISGRNPELLIGHHVIAAPMLKALNIEVIPTGYLLIDGGSLTTVSYMSNTTPIPANKPQIAACTALAGQMLGLKVLYLDSGSGAKNAISAEMIKTVNASVNLPIIVGGGIRTPQAALTATQAGADVVVVGNAAEKNPNLIIELTATVHQQQIISTI